METIANQRKTENKGWKWDVDIYDRPGWNSMHWYGGGIQKRKDNEIVIRINTADKNGVCDDFYIEHYRKVVLSSKDGGLTWGEIEPYPEIGKIVLSDGTLVEIVRAKDLLSREEQKVRLEKFGIGHIWRDDCLLIWDLWPSSMTEELKKKGLAVWEKQADPDGHRYLPDGIVATYAPSAFIARRSIDRGKTWEEYKIQTLDISLFSHFTCCFQGGIVLPDDTILVPCYGIRKDAPALNRSFLSWESGIYILCSENKGNAWQVIEIPLIKKVGLNETFLTYHPSGRVVALIRSNVKGNIYESYSDDEGKNWSAPKKTGMSGNPLDAICLKSGNILCTYGNRGRAFGGILSTLSYDIGENWDVENTKVIRNSCSTGGPGTVQLDDGTIFTYYSLAKTFPYPTHFNIFTDGCIAGSRFTENYVMALGK